MQTYELSTLPTGANTVRGRKSRMCRAERRAALRSRPALVTMLSRVVSGGMTAVVGRDNELRAIDSFLAAERRANGCCSSPARPASARRRSGARRCDGRSSVGSTSCRPAPAPPRRGSLTRRSGICSAPASTSSCRPSRSRRRGRSRSPSADARRKEHPSTRPRSPSRSMRACALSPETTSVLVAVDDVQWLDEPSAAALAFALRRLDDDVRFVLAQRVRRRVGPAARPRPLPARAPGPRRDRAAQPRRDRSSRHRATRRVVLPPDHAAALRHRERQPVLRARARSCTLRGRRPRRAGRAAARAGVARRAARRPARRLPAPTLATLLPVAALREPTAELVAAALDVTDLDARLRPAIAAHVVELDRGRVRFTHPLLATAIYAASRRPGPPRRAPCARRRRTDARGACPSPRPGEQPACLGRRFRARRGRAGSAGTRLTGECRRAVRGCSSIHARGCGRGPCAPCSRRPQPRSSTRAMQSRAAASIEALLGETVGGEERVDAQLAPRQDRRRDRPTARGDAALVGSARGDDEPFGRRGDSKQHGGDVDLHRLLRPKRSRTPTRRLLQRGSAGALDASPTRTPRPRWWASSRLTARIRRS